MQRPVLFGLLLAFLFLAAGQGLWQYSKRWPYYTDEKAMKHLSDGDYDLSKKAEYEQAWYTGMRKLTTPRKRYADLGVGLMGWGLGFAGISVGVALYRRKVEERRQRFFFNAWCVSWLVTIPGAFWYYGYHAFRGDYPWWADSIGGSFITTIVTATMGWGLTYFALRGLLQGRKMPDRVEWIGFEEAGGWNRCAPLGLWIGLLLFLAWSCLNDGDPGSGAGLLWGSALLLVVFSAKKKLPSIEIAPADEV